MGAGHRRVYLSLQGQDGNAALILGRFCRAAKKAGWSPNEIQDVLDEARAGNYDHLIQTIIQHTEEPEGEG